MAEYVLCIGTLFWMVLRGFPHVCMYRWGLTLTQWLIPAIIGVATCIICGILATILNSLAMSGYFSDELESSIEL